MAETTVDMSADDSKKEYIRALEQRDQRIDQLKTELENVTRLKNQELANLTQKMEFIMDEKDHQIKVSLINRQPDGLTVTVRDDYTSHDTRWQCTAKTFIMVCLDAYMLNLT